MTRFNFTPARSLGLATAVSAVLLVGCESVNVEKYFDFAKVDHATPSGNAFQNALFNEYRLLTHSEAAQNDFVDANRYGTKALMAASGKSVEADNLSSRKLADADRAVFETARSRLQAVFGRGAIERFPAESARAQTRFDCWVEEQEENIQPDDIAACRRAFETTIAKLEELTKPVPKPVVQAPVSRPVPPPLPGPYTISFRPNKDNLSADATALINKAAADYRSGRVARMAVQAHADRMGDENYNDRLSLRRANAVVQLLRKGGVPEQAISIATYGERKPRVPTNDGVAEQRNRVVEISFAR